MLCSTDSVGLQREGWLYELKLDGVRIVADRHGGSTVLTYRTGRSATEAYPEIAEAVGSLPAERMVLDGEIVALDPSGRPSFQRLARRIHATRPREVGRLAVEVPVVYAVFDVLAVGDLDLRELPLGRRKEMLAELVPDAGSVRVLDHLADDGTPLWDLCERLDLEGLVAKRIDSPYREGPGRSPDWVKLKRVREEDFVVVGYTRGEGGRSSLGALDLASYANGELVIRGKVGSGLSEADIDALLPLLQALATDEPPVRSGWMGAKRGRTYVRPELVVRVSFQRWSDEGRLRAPVFRGLRVDVEAASCDAVPPGG